ncbi:MAG: hypothetical protein GKR94_09220 [Gammaproteobacteria bacterium]|nr:hypothetical protein [Gammaproteobacteria bacterium]
MLIPLLLSAAAGADIPLVRALSAAGYCISGALIALVMLRYGAMQGAFVLGAVVALVGGVSVVGVGGTPEGLLLVVAGWVPTAVSALVLRHSNAQGPALLAAGAIAVFIWTAAWFVNGGGLHETALSGSALSDGGSDALLGASNGLHMMPELSLVDLVVLMLMSLLMTAASMLFLGRSWHAMLDKPGGFGEEFRALRFPRWFAYCFAGAVLGSLLTTGGGAAFLGGMTRIATVLFLFQGIAIVHAIVNARGAWVGWLVAMYLSLPVTYLFLVTGGFADTFMDFRRRAGIT